MPNETAAASEFDEARTAAELIANAAERAATLVAGAAEKAATIVAAAAESASDPSVVLLIQRIDERTESTDKSVEKLLHAVFEGNGQPSVLSRISTLEERLSLIHI